MPHPVMADFRVCNKTTGRVGLAIGVQEGPIRITQGWFNIKANSCETPVKEDLKKGPYFIYAVDYDRGGDWSGEDLLCVSDREFYIEGGHDCFARGYDRGGFRQIDTKGLKSWTLDLNDLQLAPAQDQPKTPDRNASEVKNPSQKPAPN
jgi:uncharacterized membrane protein